MSGADLVDANALRVWAIVAALCAITLILGGAWLLWTARARPSGRPLRYGALALDGAGAIGAIIYAILATMAYQRILAFSLPRSLPSNTIIQNARSYFTAYILEYQHAGWVCVGITCALLIVTAVVASRK